MRPRALTSWAAAFLLSLTAVARAQDAAGEPAVEYLLTRATGQPGDQVSLVLTVRSQIALASLSVAITFDARVLRADNVIRLPGDPTSADPADEVVAPGGLLEVRINNPGELAVQDPEGTFPEDQGFIFLRLDGGDDAVLDTDGPMEVFFELQFTILPLEQDFTGPLFSPIGFETIEFPSPPGAPPPEGEDRLGNEFQLFDDEAPEQDPLPPEVLEDGGVIILGLGEIGFFRRGDANRDCAFDLRDSLYTFGFLFQGSVQPPCKDALDSNDDGFLDLSDGIFTLHWLFAEGSAPPAPLIYGVDPTDDDLPCEHRADPCPDAL